MTEQEMQESITWLLARPACLHDIMIRFPPSCRVMANRPLHVPGPNKVGQVVGYVESDSTPPLLRVVELPDGQIGAECQQDWLEVVGYWEHITPEFVKLVLDKG